MKQELQKECERCGETFTVRPERIEFVLKNETSFANKSQTEIANECFPYCDECDAR